MLNKKGDRTLVNRIKSDSPPEKLCQDFSQTLPTSKLIFFSIASLKEWLNAENIALNPTTLSLNSGDFEELWQESFQNDETAYWSNDWEEFCKYPKQLGEGYNHWMKLRDGLWLSLIDYGLMKTTKERSEYLVESLQWLSFFVAGNISTFHTKS